MGPRASCGGTLRRGENVGSLRGVQPPVPASVTCNNYNGPWAARLRETEWLQAGQMIIYAIHDLSRLEIEPSAAGVRVVVSGHSHKPVVEERRGVLYVNPGSSGPRRFSLPISA